MQARIFDRATPADIDGLTELELQCFRQPWSRESIASEFEAHAGAGLLLRDPAAPGRLIAALFYRRVDDEAHLFRVAVAPEHRRRGIGADLIAEFIRRARADRLRAAVLEVGCANSAALGLYRRFGFRIVGTRKGYYDGAREDALILNLNLHEEDV